MHIIFAHFDIIIIIRASDRLRQKKGNFAAFSREIMRQIMRFF